MGTEFLFFLAHICTTKHACYHTHPFCGTKGGAVLFLFLFSFYFLYFIEKVDIVINTNNEHNVPAPVPAAMQAMMS